MRPRWTKKNGITTEVKTDKYGVVIKKFNHRKTSIGKVRRFESYRIVGDKLERCIGVIRTHCGHILEITKGMALERNIKI